MTERIEIVDSDQNWSEEFRTIFGPLRSALGDLALRIDHIGSTSVPGISANDVIDIRVTVTELDREAISDALAPLGYSCREDVVGNHAPPGFDATPELWQKLDFRAQGGQRPPHLNVRREGRPNLRYLVLFRDYLREHRAAAEAYAQVKSALARLHPTDLDAYYDVKDPMCDLIMQAAEQWADMTSWGLARPTRDVHATIRPGSLWWSGGEIGQRCPHECDQRCLVDVGQ